MSTSPLVAALSDRYHIERELGAGVVAGMCVVAVPVALAPVTSWGQHLSRNLVYVLLCIGTTLLVLRAVASLVQTGYLVVVGRFELAALGVWEPWFYLGALLFGMCTWRSRQARLERS